jgi:hypothetical protein
MDWGEFGWWFQNGIVPEWEGVTERGFGEDFVGFALRCSSILGIAGIFVMLYGYAFG